MFWFENYKANYSAGTLDDSSFSKHMSTVLTENVVFHSPYVPVNQSLAPLFEDRNGFDELMSLYAYQKNYTSVTTISSPDDVAVATVDGVLYYHQIHTGRFGEGEDVSWETSCKLTFNATTGKIQEILLTVINSEPLNQAYATEI